MRAIPEPDIVFFRKIFRIFVSERYGAHLHINQSVPSSRENRSPQTSISPGVGSLAIPKLSRTVPLSATSTARALSTPAIAKSSANMPAIRAVTGTLCSSSSFCARRDTASLRSSLSIFVPSCWRTCSREAADNRYKFGNSKVIWGLDHPTLHARARHRTDV
jgi:hypothetical protein